MKKQRMLTAFILIVIGLSIVGTSAVALPASGINIIVSMVNQDPDPVEPGKYVDVRFKLENYGSQNAEDVQVRISPKYPFSIEPGDKELKSVGSIHGRQTGDVGAIVKYRLRVDKNAVQGENKLEIQYKHSGSDWVAVSEFTINVRPIEAILSIDEVISNPKQIKQGETVKVTFKLKNHEELLVRDVRVRLDLTGLPFAPVDSSTEKVIDSIEPKSVSSIDFTLVTDPSASAGINKVPVSVNYKDFVHKNYSMSSQIGLVIGSEPDLSIYIDSSTIKQSGQQGEVSIKFVNKGIADIKLLNVIIKETDEYDLLSSAEVYMGNIDSDDYETADYTIKLKDTQKDTISLPLTIEYKDAQNKDYRKEMQVPLKLYSAEQAKDLGLNNGNSKVGIIVTVLIVVVGLVAYVIWRKRKRK